MTKYTQIKNEIEKQLSDYNSRVEITGISIRECESENFTKGVEIIVTGDAIPIMPLIRSIHELENYKINTIDVYNDAESYLNEDDELVTEMGVVMYCPKIVDSKLQSDNLIFTHR